jgi:site-specific DNA-methyltransferase (adenine-specific)
LRKEPIAHCEPKYFDGTGEIHEIDAIKLAGQLPNESVDLIIIDPAYESLEKWRKMGTTTRLKKSKSSSNEWFEIFKNENYSKLFGHLYRVLKPGSFLYMFCDEETRDVVTCGYSPQTQTGWDGLPLINAGFKYWKAIVWDKQVAGLGYHFRAQHEFILMAEKVVKKGKHRKLNTNKSGDVLSCKRLKGKQYYPTEKPPALIWTLINESSNKEDVVLDCFSGSGIVGQLCQRMGRYFILGDINAKESIRRIEGKIDLSK